MFSGRGMVPWHRLGTVVNGLLTSGAALEAARLLWEVQKCPAYFARPFSTEAVLMPDRFAMVRGDNGRYLGNVGAAYEPLQNVEAFGLMDAIVGEGRAVYDTAGALFGGRKVWVSAKLNPADYGPEIMSNERAERYILLTNDHSGEQSLRLDAVSVRVVCNNTLTMALGRAGAGIRLRHVGNIQESAEEARAALGLVTAKFDEMDVTLRALRDLKFTAEEMKEFSWMLTDRAGERNTLRDLFRTGVGCEGRSRWDALNAVTQLTTHALAFRGDSRAVEEKRLDASLSGRGATMQATALTYLARGM